MWEQIGIVFTPVLFYQLLSIVLIVLGQGIFGSDSSAYIACQTLMAVCSIPLMYYLFLLPDLKRYGTRYFSDFEQQNSGRREILVSRWTITVEQAQKLLASVVVALLIGTGLNNLILMSPLAAASTGYTQAAEDFYSSTVLLEIVCSGILVPVLEEIVYRGILYGRMRRLFGAGRALLFSSLVFGILHFNLVQFVYAFLMGLVFVALLEKTGKLICTMAAHMAVNTLAVVRTETGLMETTADGSLFAWVTSFAFLLLGIAALYLYVIPLIRDLRSQIQWESAKAAGSRRGKTHNKTK